MREKKIHASRFAGYRSAESLGGPVVTEAEEPLCGVRADDPELEHGFMPEDEEKVTCLRCRRILRRGY